jgi:hypothetical protein
MPTKEGVKKFIVRDASLVRSATARFLTDDSLRKAILQNNDQFKIMRDVKEQGTVVSCKNKPRDMLVYGIVWEELDGD